MSLGSQSAPEAEELEQSGLHVSVTSASPGPGSHGRADHRIRRDEVGDCTKVSPGTARAV